MGGKGKYNTWSFSKKGVYLQSSYIKLSALREEQLVLKSYIEAEALHHRAKKKSFLTIVKGSSSFI